jgi:cytochrome c biogenesis factor
MKTVLTIIAVLLMISGAIWVLQGLSLIGGSFMVGQTRWIYMGIVTLLIGAGLLFFARKNNRRP